MTGPFETEAEARESRPARRARMKASLACDARDAATRRGAGADPRGLQAAVDAPCLEMLTGARAAAGVEPGAYDRRILTWRAGWEPETCAVVAGIIARAAAGRDGAR